MVQIPLDQKVFLGLVLGWTTLNSTHTRTSHLFKNKTQLKKKKSYRNFTFCQPKIGCPTTDKALQVLRDHNFSSLLEEF